MQNIKSKALVIVLVLFLLLNTGCNRPTVEWNNKLEDNKNDEKMAYGAQNEQSKIEENLKNNKVTKMESKGSKTQIELEGDLLLSHSREWIFLDSRSIINGSDKKMECDLDGDGNTGYFLIGRDSPNGTKILAAAQKSGYNLAYNTNLNNAFDEFGHLSDGYGFQVTCYDLDNDGIKEIIVSIGNQSYEMESIIYRYTKSIDKPFELVGFIYGQDKMYVKEDGTIISPYGSQGLAAEYKYFNKNLYKVDLDGKLTIVEKTPLKYKDDHNRETIWIIEIEIER